MKAVLKYFKPFIFQFIILLGAVYLSVAATLALPDLMAKIIDEGIVGTNQTIIWQTGGWMLLLSLGAATASFITGFFASRIAAGYARDFRQAIFTKIESFSLAEFNAFSTASLITRTTNDIQQIQMVLTMLLRMALMAPFMGIWAIIKALQTAPSMAWIMGLAVGILLVVIISLFILAIPKFKRLQKLVDRLNLVSREILTGLRVIRAFNREEYEEKKFNIANADLMNVNIFVNRLLVVMQPMMMIIMNVAALAVIWFGTRLIDAGSLQIGGMLAFMQYAMQAVMSFLLISIVFIIVPRAIVSLQRINEVLITEALIKDPINPTTSKTSTTGSLEFKNVSFSYSGADEPILHDISFIAKPGKTTAFIGSTGSGKSTLINLIPRFYDVTSGSIEIDGIDIRQMRLEDLYGKIGYVPQQSTLFSGTIKTNIEYGRPGATALDIEQVTDIAQAKEFVDQLPEQYNSAVSQGGVNFSGGQKQRLSIARALIRRPEIYIFDDSFSALDFTTDAKLRQKLAAKTTVATVLIVAQRISTIINADQIIVLDEGRMVGRGTHAELMKSSSVYREIALSQLSDDELPKDLSSAKLQLAKDEII
ncbi:MAG: ABC transporter ATP-binding protein [Patescibacteria group bacterium]